MAATSPTVSEVLEHSNITDLAHALKKLKIHTWIAGQIPRVVTRTGLANAAAQILYTADGQPSAPVKQPFQIHAVTLADDTPLAIILNGAVGSGEVLVAYDADGVPTLTFNAAVTGFKIAGCPLPTGWSTILAGVLG